jgi:hypothetical protein
MGVGARIGLLALGLLLGCGDDLPDARGGASTGVATTLHDEGSTTRDPNEGTTGDATTGMPITATDGTGTSTSLGTSTGDASSTEANGSTSTGPDPSTGDPVTASTTLGTTDGDPSEGDPTEGTSTGEPGEPVCIDEDLGGALVTVLGDTSLVADDWDPPCAPGLGGPDRGHRFVAPADGFYAFDTLGTAGLDTVLYAFAGEACAGPAVACNDDVGLGQVQSRISMYLQEDSPVVVMVDGFDATQAGPYALDIDAVLGACAATDLMAVPEAYALADNSGQHDKLQGSCVDAPGRDVVFRWVAPYDGTFVIDTLDSSFDTVLHLRLGQCGFVEVGCNDDALGGVQSRLVIVATGGTEIAIVVDGFGLAEVGPLALRIEPL